MAERPRRPRSMVGHLVAATARSFSATGRMAVLQTAGAALLVVCEAVGALILLDRFGGIGGWTASEVLLLFGLADAGLGLGMLAADPLEPPTFSQLLRDGRFDQVLTRPISPLLFVVATDIQIRYLGRFAAGWVIATIALVTSGAAVSIAAVALMVLATVAMAVTVAALLVIGASITMFTIEGTEVLNAFTYGGATMAGWPLQIYSGALRAVFVWAVPVGVSVYVPTLWILGRDGPSGAGRWMLPLVPLLVAAFCGAAALSWRVGLRRYTGVGA
ncbi:ABC transporter permease [Actinospongicola halichondriae]|uniref:ABC transporter permease n=1 Tax=Actinospongicola halichondriae TaxID=3236844 RepID=UPI003D57B000